MGWISTVTNKGYALQAKLLSTDKLEITRVVSGSGSCATTQLINQTAVTDIKQELIVDSLGYDNHGNARIKVTLNNTNLSTGYNLSQVGIYATDPDEGEILYAILQTDKPEPIPSITEQPRGFDYSWDFALTYSNAQNVNVTIDPSNALSQDKADKRYVQLVKIGEGLELDENGNLRAKAQEITVDAELNSESTNPIQNKAVYEAIKENKYSLPKASASTLGGVKVGSGLTVDADGTLSATGTDVTIDSALSSSSTNPVQNKVVNSALNDKVDKEDGKVLSSNDYTAAEKEKLAGIAEGANKYTHPAYTAKESGLYKVTVDSTGHVSGITPVTKSDITDLGIPSSDTKYTHPTNTAYSAGLYKVTVDKNGHVVSATAVTKDDITALGIEAKNDRNTAGCSDTSKKIFLVGATAQASSEIFGYQTYSHDTVYVGTDGCLYSDSKKVSVEGHTHTEYADKSHTHSEYADKSHTHDFDSLGVSSISLDGLINVDNYNTVREPTTDEKNNLNGLKAAVLLGCKNKCLKTTGTNEGACLAVGFENEVYSKAVALGSNLKAWENQTVVGKYNNYSGDGSDYFIVGGGSSSATKNIFRVSSDTQKCYGVNSFVSSGADYAEYMEWEDGNPNNEDRRGRMVAYALTDVECTVEDVEILHPDTHEPITVKAVVYEKMPTIRYANSVDECIGVVSGSASFIGNSASEDWNSRFLKDIYGESIKQAVLIPEKTETYKVKEIDEKTGKEVIVEKEHVTPEHWEIHPVLNPHYDPEKEYISREHRQEWDPVGMVGMVVVEDDGTCVVGGYCKPSTNGRGTAAETGYRVLQRIDNTHVRVLVK